MTDSVIGTAHLYRFTGGQGGAGLSVNETEEVV